MIPLSKASAQESVRLGMIEFLERTDFPLEWVRVEISKADTLIPAFCNASNPRVRIYSKYDEYWMEIIYGQEFEDYKINYVQIVDELLYTFSIDDDNTFSIRFLDDRKTKGHWYYEKADPNDYVFLPLNSIEHIKPEEIDCIE